MFFYKDISSNSVCIEREVKHYYLLTHYANEAGEQASTAPECDFRILYNNEEKKFGPTKK